MACHIISALDFNERLCKTDLSGLKFSVSIVMPVNQARYIIAQNNTCSSHLIVQGSKSKFNHITIGLATPGMPQHFINIYS